MEGRSVEITVQDAAAEAAWKARDARKAGRLIFEAVPPGRRASWAGRILVFACGQAGVRSSRFDRIVR